MEDLVALLMIAMLAFVCFGQLGDTVLVLGCIAVFLGARRVWRDMHDRE